MHFSIYITILLFVLLPQPLSVRLSTLLNPLQCLFSLLPIIQSNFLMELTIGSSGVIVNMVDFSFFPLSSETAVGLSNRGHLRGEGQQVPSEDRPAPEGQEWGPPTPPVGREVETLPEECGTTGVVGTGQTWQGFTAWCLQVSFRLIPLNSTEVDAWQ